MKVLIAFVLGAVLATPALADDKRPNFTGCYVGAQAGYGATQNSTSLDVNAPSISLAGSLLDMPLSSQGGNIGLHAGCDLQFQQFVFGGFADYNWMSQKMEVTSPLLGALTTMPINPIARMDIDSMWTVGGRAGLVFGNTLAYALIGYTQMDSSDLTMLGSIGGTFGVPSFKGWTLGGGLATELAPNIILSAEYRWTRFDKVDVPLYVSGGYSISMGMQPEMHTAMARLSYRFSLPGLQ